MSTQHKYMEIKSYIINQLQQGVYLSGEKIESENTLMKKFSVSRMTVRQAINELQNENVLVTVKGKGTFVQTNKIKNMGSFLTSFSENAKMERRKLGNKIISFKKVTSNEYQDEVFQFEKPTKLWEIKRIRYLDGLPAAYQESYIPVVYIPSLSTKALEESLYSYLDRQNISINSANQKIVAVLASAEIASYLEIEQQSPLVKMIQKAYDYRLCCMELNYCYYHPTHYEVLKTLIRKKRSSFSDIEAVSILFASSNSTISGAIEEEIQKIIGKEAMRIRTFNTEIKDIDRIIHEYDIVLLDPRFRYAKEDLVARFPNKCIIVMDMGDFARMDAKKILLESIQQYEETKK